MHPGDHRREALRKFQEARPQIVVLDIMMPDMDGLVVLDAIRRIDGNVPVILITGLVGEGVARQVERHHRRWPSSKRARGWIASWTWSTRRWRKAEA